MVKKLALCFLVTKNIAHWPIWERWMQGNEDKLAIFAHYSPSHASNITQRVLKENRIPKCIPTKWGDISLVHAEGLLYASALRDRAVSHVVLVSPSDIPITSFAHAYRRIVSSKRSFVGFMDDISGGFVEDYTCVNMLKSSPACTRLAEHYRLFDGECFGISQWKILNRPDAREFVNMLKVKPFVKLFSSRCTRILPHKRAPDEVMYTTWMNHRLHKRKRKIYTHFRNENTTYVEFVGKIKWDSKRRRFYVQSAAHPTQIKRIGKRRARAACAEKSMFMRKVDLAPDTLGDQVPLVC
jgi:hypothetical protein